MPSIRFEGREHVHAHHLSVPHRSLIYDKSRSMGKSDDGNLIIHGDNLEALKALLPRYAGRGGGGSNAFTSILRTTPETMAGCTVTTLTALPCRDG